MWSVNIKIWIVLIIFNTVKCQMVEYYGRGLPGGIMFPGPIDYNYNQNAQLNPSQSRSTCANCENYPPISLDHANEIDELESYDEILNYIENKLDIRRELVATRFGDEQERSNGVDPPSGKCRPEERVVPFKDEALLDNSFYYLPSCTRVKRCGGCCASNLKSCQPTNQTMTNYKVVRIDFASKEFTEVIVPLEEHTSCECLCSIKSDSCTGNLEYNAKKCRCECRNTEEKKKCLRNSRKRWDADNCTCMCRQREECHTGLEFNEDLCRCEEPHQGNNIYETQINRKINYTLRPFPTLIVNAPSASSPRRRHKDED